METNQRATQAAMKPPNSSSRVEVDTGLGGRFQKSWQASLRSVKQRGRPAQPSPALDGFTKAFRKCFEVPAEAPSVADRIYQRQHHDWIEMFLVQHIPSWAAAPIG